VRKRGPGRVVFPEVDGVSVTLVQWDDSPLAARQIADVQAIVDIRAEVDALFAGAREQTQDEHDPRRRSGDAASTGGGE